MSPESHNMAYCMWIVPIFIYIYIYKFRVGIDSKMTKCAVRIFVTKYSFCGIHPIFMKFWQELKQLINLVLNAFLLIANSKHACTDCQRKEISSERQGFCHFIPIFSRT